MKKINILLTVLMLQFVLSGCSRIDNYLENQIEEHSGMMKTSDYQSYKGFEANGHLDQDGYYLQEAFESENTENSAPQGTTRITFATNTFIRAQYYSDPDFLTAISTSEVFLNPGDCVYAEVSLERTAPSSTYVFSGFRISEISADGTNTPIRTVLLGETGLVIQISEDDIGKELSIAPIGNYLPRTVTLRDSYIDNDEQEHALSGKWIINDQPVIGHSVEINPVSSYIISYEFDSDQYFFVSSEPKCFYSNNEDGIVIFNKREAADETLDYSVQLHQYVTVRLQSNQLRHVSVNNGYEEEIKPGGTCEIKHLRYGDRIVIVSDAEWRELAKSREAILQSSETLEQNGNRAYKYTLIIPQKDWQFEFNPAEYSYAHGTLSFTCFGEEVTTIQYLPKGSQIYYAQHTADDGYLLPQGEHVIVVTTPEETRRALESIVFEEAKRVTVHLKQPPYGGRIEYYVNGSKIQASEYKGDSGTEITMKFFPWEGWKNNYNNGEKYRITSATSQSIYLRGRDISTSAFTESDLHKPNLTVILESSVGSDMIFEIEASGLSRKAYSYESPIYVFELDDTIIEPTKIGTEKGVSVYMKNRAIQSGTAIKILIEMSGEDKSGNKPREVSTSYYRLIDSLTDIPAPIDVYSAEIMGSSGVWYKSIKITISLVDVLKYKRPNLPATGIVTVRNAETGKVLKNGDILEGSEKVTVTISAANGYYVDGKNVKNGIYQTTISFDDCVSEIQKMVDEHPIKKYCRVTLDSKDDHGTCLYKYNGRVVSGTIYVKPKDTITIEYAITDSSYVIEGVSGILGIPWGVDNTKIEKELTIDEKDDGKTLTRESFGIVVTKG